MKIMLVVGARPNFMKIASIMDAINLYNLSTEQPIDHILVHTGQHYDDSMSEVFFRDLQLPKPDIHLEVGSASHAVQTAEIMRRFEPILYQHRPDVVVVVGDVNSTIACALVAAKACYPAARGHPLTTLNHQRPLIAHVESGLRSFDRTMPEEINRVLTDSISDLLFITEESAGQHLRREGVAEEKIFFVGNTMIDTLLKHLKIAQRSNILERLDLLSSNQERAAGKPALPYALLTLHRPTNVDDKEAFQNILEALKEISRYLPVIFPVHPRTLNRIKEFNCEDKFESLPTIDNPAAGDQGLGTESRCSAASGEKRELSRGRVLTRSFGIHGLDPLGYLDFLCLMANAKLVLTDSGGIQEETTVLNIPCITLRENTERPITVAHGTNVIVGANRRFILKEVLKRIEADPSVKGQDIQYPPLWDGSAGQRIVGILVDKVVRQRLQIGSRARSHSA